MRLILISLIIFLEVIKSLSGDGDMVASDKDAATTSKTSDPPQPVQHTTNSMVAAPTSTSTKVQDDKNIKTPAAVPAPGPPAGNDPLKDAEELNKDLAHKKKEQSKIKDLLPNRTCKQRQALQTEYDKKYGLNLYKTIAKYTGKTFETILKCCFFCDGELLAVFLDKAFEKGARTSAMRCIIMASETEELKEQFKTFYKKRYGNDVINLVNKHWKPETATNHMLVEILNRKRKTQDTSGSSPEDIAKNLVQYEPFWRKDNFAVLDSFLIETPIDLLRSAIEAYKGLGDKHDLVKSMSSMCYYYLALYLSDPVEFSTMVMNDYIPDTDYKGDVKPLIFIGLYMADRNITSVMKRYKEKYPNQDFIGKMKEITKDNKFEDLLQAFYEKGSSPSTAPATGKNPTPATSPPASAPK